MSGKSKQTTQQALAWYDPETHDVVSDQRKQAWMTQYGAPGKVKAAAYTVPLYAAPQDAEVESKWRPISTAPKTGLHILARLPDSDSCYTICWSDASKGIRPELGPEPGWRVAFDGRLLSDLDQPECWQPLPAPPKSNG